MWHFSTGMAGLECAFVSSKSSTWHWVERSTLEDKRIPGRFKSHLLCLLGCAFSWVESVIVLHKVLPGTVFRFRFISFIVYMTIVWVTVSVPLSFYRTWYNSTWLAGWLDGLLTVLLRYVTAAVSLNLYGGGGGGGVYG